MSQGAGTSPDGDALFPTEVDEPRVRGDADTPFSDAAAGGDARPQVKLPGVSFGRYQLKEKIGSGGMGVVYRAYDPMLERHVALKIVRPAKGGAAAQRRLFREGQLLAQVRHPNVVSVYDVGVLGKDVFVAMEFINDTIPLSRWQKERDWQEILHAYVEAGRGLAAAHKSGLIHRDFKPDNVLVDAEGQVTVIDFGLATMLDGGDLEVSTDLSVSISETPSSLSDKLTLAGAAVGTPRYMSPEQHDPAADLDARSDQYSFAVALYEALCDMWPFAYLEPCYSGQELIAAKLRATVSPPVRKVPQPIIAALLRALAPDPSGRWASMEELLRQLVPRQKRMVAWWAVPGALAAIAALAIPGAVRNSTSADAEQRCAASAASIEEVWNSDARRALERTFRGAAVSFAADTASRVVERLDERAQRWSKARRRVCEATWLRGEQSESLLDLRMRCLDRRRRAMAAIVDLFGSGEMEGELLGRAVQATASLDTAETCVELQPDDRPAVSTSDDPQLRDRVDSLQARIDELKIFLDLGKFEDGETRGERVLGEAEALASPLLQAEALYYLGGIRRQRGNLDGAEAAYARGLPLAGRAGAPALEARLGAQRVFVLGYLGRHEEATLLVPHVEAAVVRAGERTDVRAELANAIGVAQWAKGDFAAAETYFERAVAWKGESASEMEIAASLTNLADAMFRQKKYSQAIERLERAREVAEAGLGSGHPYVSVVLNGLGLAYQSSGRGEEALRLFRQALEIAEGALGARHAYVATACTNIGEALDRRGGFTEAEIYHRRALRVGEESLPPNHRHVGMIAHNLGVNLNRQDKYAVAMPYHVRALKLFEATLGQEHEYTAVALTGLGEAEFGVGETGAARASLTRALAVLVAEKSEYVPDAQFALARALWATTGERPRALELARSARAAWAERAGFVWDLQRVDLWLHQRRGDSTR